MSFKSMLLLEEACIASSLRDISIRHHSVLSGLAVVISLTCLLITKVAGSQLANVQVNEPGEWRTLSVGVTSASSQTTTGPTAWWRDIGTTLSSKNLEFYWLDDDPNKTTAVQYGLVDFTVTTSGTIWMVGAYRPGGGGNSSGDWLPEYLSPTTLAAMGWNIVADDIKFEVGYGAYGTNDLWDIDGKAHYLYERYCTAGEVFSIRTDKYWPPALIREIPEPATAVIFVILGCAMAVTQRSVKH